MTRPIPAARAAFRLAALAVAAVVLHGSAAQADPAADLERARAAHAKELARLKVELLAAFDARLKENQRAGRGNDYLLPERKAFADRGVTPLLPEMQAAARAYVDGKRKADEALAADFPAAIRACEQAGQADRAAALAREMRKLRGVPEPIRITPALLKDRFAGRAEYDKAADLLTLTYDLTDKADLRDFAAGRKASPAVGGGTLSLAAKEEVTHIANLSRCTVSGVLTAAKTEAFVPYLGFSGGVLVTGGGSLLRLGTKTSADLGTLKAGQPAPFRLAVGPAGAALELGGKAGRLDFQVSGGHVWLLGGPGGTRFSRLVIAGVPDPEWAAKFFKEDRPDRGPGAGFRAGAPADSGRPPPRAPGVGRRFGACGGPPARLSSNTFRS